MTDLTFCYLHMTQNDLDILDTIGTSDYFTGELSDSGTVPRNEYAESSRFTSLADIDIPSHMVPPNPDDSDVLPSQVHPSYPYGNPTNIKHPAAKPRRPYDPSSRALFEDMGYAGGGVNGSLRWKDLALDLLLPVDEEKEEAEKAAQARKMASGVTANHAPPTAPPAAPVGDDDDSSEDSDEGDNSTSSSNTTTSSSDGDEEEEEDD
ncbi:hypothetical protein NLI96_g753 [Meripilus lineatus]|uniref:Uncharacterized protein n=1 Tax=Meripilus lineatus TaxID=2056292 RepID=A0AAD5VBR3_9APHY|nr:hypothetical protein NLI96_g753 [Physisporinus lineatus]